MLSEGFGQSEAGQSAEASHRVPENPRASSCRQNPCTKCRSRGRAADCPARFPQTTREANFDLHCRQTAWKSSLIPRAVSAREGESPGREPRQRQRQAGRRLSVSLLTSVDFGWGSLSNASAPLRSCPDYLLRRVFFSDPKVPPLWFRRPSALTFRRNGCTMLGRTERRSGHETLSHCEWSFRRDGREVLSYSGIDLGRAAHAR